ncbi:polysaccharide biosynthesis/export family protein [Devosia sp. FJ2-5-3]|uniref:polysaccharide biosynthesis/export family protein n=1 Tax=Devosia sp. FJ2-5-3 TaxID=2976680 RepID=UPI0023D8C4FC|nr:polysaccharide biosynthesis/export family protein [Devosia sp. FJ2-5-3]WEJ57299.1 polysaccharide export protein [Devosia sp. FJ2-5-3]
MRWLPFLALTLLMPLAACSTTSTLPSTYLVDTKGAYTLDTGDVVRVSVYGDAELTNTYRINDSGAIAFPLVGSVQVRGQTTGVAASRIAGALANGFMRNPNVAVEVAEYRPFFIQGEVRTSGQFPYVYGMTARSAISTAGGFNETADRTKVTVYRRQGSEMVKGNVELDFPLSPGDTIVVNERWF